MDRVFDVRVRRWIYNVALCVFLLLAGYGVMESDKVALWAALAGAVTGLARANVPGDGFEGDGE